MPIVCRPQKQAFEAVARALALFQQDVRVVVQGEGDAAMPTGSNTRLCI